MIAITLMMLFMVSEARGGTATYKVYKTKKTWQEADKVCQNWGGSLVRISSRTQNEDVLKKAKSRGLNKDGGWIGLNDIRQERTFVWGHENTVHYRNWNKKEPNGGRKENCVHMYHEHGFWNDKSCKRKLPFICQKGIWPDVTYKFGDKSKSWYDAEKVCRSWGGNLVVISSEEQNVDLLSRMKKRGLKQDAWIGLNDDAQEGTYVWGRTTGLVEYRNWKNGEPNGGTGENCVVMYGDSGTWNDLSCKRKRGFICQKGQAPPPFSPKVAYMFGTEKLKWSDAQKDCALWEGRLLSISSAEEEANMVAEIRSRSNFDKHTWIGLNDIHKEGTFVWDGTNEDTKYRHWKKGEPNNKWGKEDCTELNTESHDGYAWNDQSCNDKRSYICQRDMAHKEELCPGKGWCLTTDGIDQNEGVKPIHASSASDCKAKCSGYHGATGCEFGGNVCAVHTKPISHGSGQDGYECWVLSAC